MISIHVQKKLLGSQGDMNLDINLNINEYDFIAISGKSGSGKSTFLRILSGLEKADGEITVDNISWLNTQRSLSPQHRNIGFMFQDYALFDNMNVIDNLLYVSKDIKLANQLLELTQLDTLKLRYPKSLSGGQKQRVALCRAFMNRPKLLLMDEPLSALDPAMRSQLQEEILSLHKTFKTTTIMVSHDPAEIYKLASRVIVFDHGSIINDATPKEILLKTNGSQKFALNGEIVDIIKADILYVAIIAIGQQIVEVVLDQKESELFHIGEYVGVSTKAFSPSLFKVYP